MTPPNTPHGIRPTLIASFEALADQYEVLFFDAYGVLKNAMGVLPGVPQLLANLAARGKTVFVLTNDASKSPRDMAATYNVTELGTVLEEQAVICSGRLAENYLRRRVARGRVAYFGKPGAACFVTEAGHEAVPIDLCNGSEMVDAIAFLDDEGFDWQRSLTVALNILRRREVPVLVANSDSLYPLSNTEVAIAVGGLASMLERELRFSFVRFGKPNTELFEHAFAAARARHPTLERSQVLMVGDTPHTDMLGANRFGIDSALVLSGNTDLGRNSLPQLAEKLGTTPDSCPTYLCPSVVPLR